MQEGFYSHDEHRAKRIVNLPCQCHAPTGNAERASSTRRHPRETQLQLALASHHHLAAPSPYQNTPSIQRILWVGFLDISTLLRNLSAHALATADDMVPGAVS